MSQIIEMGDIFGILSVLMLLLLSGILSASEVAFFSLTPNHIRELKGSNHNSDIQILKLLEKPKKLMATLLLANNTVNIGIVVLSTFIVNRHFNFIEYPVLGFIIQAVIIAFVLLLIGEIIPKVYASLNPVHFARFFSPFTKFLVSILFPFSFILEKFTSLIDKRVEKKGHQITIDELSHAIDLTTHDKDLVEEQGMLKGIVKFGDIDVKEVMTPRTDVIAFNIETDYKTLLLKILDAGFSRIPIFVDSFDQIEGILYIKDLLAHIDEYEFFEWQKLIRPALFVPESKKINDLLQEFQKKKIHLAIVVDEYGGTSGIVSLEDIIEEIVGEINDEFDEEENDFVKLSDRIFIFEGKTSLNDLTKQLSLSEDEFDDIRGDAETLAGLILEINGTIPFKNEEFRYKKYVFSIESVNKRRIEKIKIIINPDEDAL